MGCFDFWPCGQSCFCAVCFVAALSHPLRDIKISASPPWGILGRVIMWSLFGHEKISRRHFDLRPVLWQLAGFREKTRIFILTRRGNISSYLYNSGEENFSWWKLTIFIFEPPANHRLRGRRKIYNVPYHIIRESRFYVGRIIDFLVSNSIDFYKVALRLCLSTHADTRKK